MYGATTRTMNGGREGKREGMPEWQYDRVRMDQLTVIPTWVELLIPILPLNSTKLNYIQKFSL